MGTIVHIGKIFKRIIVDLKFIDKLISSISENLKVLLFSFPFLAPHFLESHKPLPFLSHFLLHAAVYLDWI